MKARSILFLSVILLVSLPNFSQDSESLGEIARHARQEKAAAEHEAAVQGVSAAHQALGPITKLQLFAWIPGASSDDLTVDVKSRGIAFDLDDVTVRDLSSAGADPSLLEALRKAVRHPEAISGSGLVMETDVKDAAVAIKKDDFSGALRLLRKALQRDPHSPEILFALGNVFRKMEDWQNAGWAYSQVVESQPDLGYAHGQLANVECALDDGEGAVGEAQAMLKLLPNSADAHRFLGRGLEAEERYEEALRAYDQSLAIRPNDALVFYDIGIVRKDQNNYLAAIASYQRAIDLDSSKWYFFNNLGIAFRRLGRTDEAVAAFENGKALAPQRPELLQSYGATLCDAGRYEQAIVQFTELLQTTPDWNMARPCLYRALVRTGRTEEAERVKEDYKKYSPDGESW